MPRAGDPWVSYAGVLPGGRLAGDDQVSRRKVRRLALEVGGEPAQGWRGCIVHGPLVILFSVAMKLAPHVTLAFQGRRT